MCWKIARRPGRPYRTAESNCRTALRGRPPVPWHRPGSGKGLQSRACSCRSREVSPPQGACVRAGQGGERPHRGAMASRPAPRAGGHIHPHAVCPEPAAACGTAARCCETRGGCVPRSSACMSLSLVFFPSPPQQHTRWRWQAGGGRLQEPRCAWHRAGAALLLLRCPRLRPVPSAPRWCRAVARAGTGTLLPGAH